VIFAAAFGAATAGFLPRLAHRLAVGHADEPLAACADCSRPFPAGGPGWVRVGAACSCSGGYAWTVLTGATVASLLAVAVGPSPLLPAYLLAAVPGLLLAMIDLRCLRLPDRLVAALAVLAGVPLAVLRPGDVKLAAALALILGFAGWPAVLTGLLAAHLINGPVAVFLLVTGRAGRRRPIPFGPALLAGALLAITAA